MRVYTSIYPKGSTLSLDVQIIYLGYPETPKVGFGHINYFGDELGAYKSILPEMSN